MDLIGPFQPTALGHKYVLTMTDYFSKYVEAVPIPDKSALSVAQGIYKVYCRQGAPVSIICDQGKEFVNQVRSCNYTNHMNIHLLCNLNCIICFSQLNEGLQKSVEVKMRITSAYHPQSNGLDERTNQALKR